MLLVISQTVARRPLSTHTVLRFERDEAQLRLLVDSFSLRGYYMYCSKVHTRTNKLVCNKLVCSSGHIFMFSVSLAHNA